jgi:hypothetical protein
VGSIQELMVNLVDKTKAVVVADLTILDLELRVKADLE